MIPIFSATAYGVDLSSAVEGGWHNSKAVDSNGNIYGWGLNTTGQIGDGTTVNKSVPTLGVNIQNIKQVQSGSGHTLVLTNDGKVYSYGANNLGQLGLGNTSTTPSLTPQLIPTLTNIVEISTYANHNLALNSSGEVFSWGDNASGQLGRTGSTSTPTKIVFPSYFKSTVVKSIEASYVNSFVIFDNGSVAGWGDNFYRQVINISLSNSVLSVPEPITGLPTNVTKIRGGYLGVLALTSNGDVYSWGTNNFYQLGQPGLYTQYSPTKINGLSNIKDIVAGNTHSVALGYDKKVRTWGDGTRSGTSMTSQFYSPTIINGNINNAAAIGGGAFNTLVLTEDGKMYGFGNNTYGQVGNGTTVAVQSPVLINKVLDVSVTPNAPTSFTTSILKDTNVTLAWSASSTPSVTYEVKRNGTVVYTGTSTTFADSGLTPNTAYTYTVVAKNATGSSTAVTQNVTTKLALPTNLKFNQLSNTSGSITWDAVPGATSYVVKKNNVVVTTVKPTDTFYTDNSLAFGTNYTYTVQAKTSTNVSDISTLTFALQDTRLADATTAVNNAVALANGDLSTQSLVDAAKSAINNAQVLINKLDDGSSKTNLQNTLNDASVKVTDSQDELDAIKAVEYAVSLSNGDLGTQTLVDNAKNAITTAQGLVDKVKRPELKSSLQSQLDGASKKVEIGQLVLNAQISVNRAVELANGDLSTQALIDQAKLALAQAQVDIDNLQAILNAATAKVDNAQTLITQAQTSTLMRSFTIVQLAYVATPIDTFTQLKSNLVTAKQKVVVAQDILNAKNATNQAVELAYGDLSTQALVDNGLTAVSSAQLLVDKLSDSDIKTDLQAKLEDALSKLKLAQKIIDAQTALDKVSSSTVDLTTQDGINQAKEIIDNTQKIVTDLPEGDVKTSLQNQITDLTGKVAQAQDVVNAKDSVEKANGSTSDLSNQTAIDTATQAIADAQTLIAKLPDGDVKTALQNQVNDLTGKVAQAQDVLNAKNSVEKANGSTVDLSNQTAIDTATQAIADAQTLITKLPDGDVKIALQNQVNDLNNKVVNAQNVIDAQNNVKTAVDLSNGNLTTQAEVDNAKTAINNAQNAINKLPSGEVKTSLQSQLDVANSKVQQSQDIINKQNLANNTLDSILNVKLSTYDLVDKSITSLYSVKPIIDSLPDGTVKQDLLNKYKSANDYIATSLITLLTQKHYGKPVPLSDTSLKFLVSYVVDKLHIASSQYRGQINGFLMPMLQGKASGDQVNKAVDGYFNDKTKNTTTDKSIDINNTINDLFNNLDFIDHSKK
jgi:alpha-tubulin suppressor-like RCC1 family protein